MDMLLSSLRRQPKTTAVSFLPIELYRPIVEDVDTPCDLHTLLFVNKAFQSESERILYREIKIEFQSLEARLSLFNHLSNCQRVALHVRKLSLFCPDENRDYWRPHADKYFRAFHQALCALHLLKDLHLAHYPNVEARLWPSFSLLSDCRFQLRTLALVSNWQARPPFENQRNIEELHLWGAPWDPPPHVAFSRLSILSCDASLNPEFTKGIKALKVTSEENLEHIASTRSRFVNLVSLRMSFRYYPPIDNNVVIPLMFPSVRYIWLAYSNFSLEHIQRLMDNFQRLLKLQKVHFTAYKGMQVPAQSTISHWFSKIPSLQSIIIQADAVVHVEWTRGAERGVEVSPDEDEWKDKRWIA